MKQPDKTMAELLLGSAARRGPARETPAARLKYSTRLRPDYVESLARLAYWKRTDMADELEAALAAHFAAQAPDHLHPMPPKAKKPAG